MVRAFGFAHVELMDGILQMRLILDRGGLRYLPLRLADQGGEKCPGEGMQRSQTNTRSAVVAFAKRDALYMPAHIHCRLAGQ